jgi:hypothetical protein
MYIVFRAAPTPIRVPLSDSPNYGRATYILAVINTTNGNEVGRTAIGAPGSPVPFDPDAELNRPGLLLMKNPLTGTNVLYVAFGAPVCDSLAGPTIRRPLTDGSLPIPLQI